MADFGSFGDGHVRAADFLDERDDVGGALTSLHGGKCSQQDSVHLVKSPHLLELRQIGRHLRHFAAEGFEEQYFVIQVGKIASAGKL